MKINKLLTQVNYTSCSSRKIEFITIHYVGGTGGAEANCKYFYSINRGASAHYFVGHQGEIWQCVEDKDKAWHCGGGMQAAGVAPYYQKCTNSNSIGIEMCCKKDSSGNWYFEEETVRNTIDLTKMLMAKYGVDLEHVIRHYDIVYKRCPEPYVRDEAAWLNFKNRLIETTVQEEEEEVTQEQFNEMMKVWIADSANARPGDWSIGAREWATANNLVKGDEQGRYMWEKFMTREEFVTVLSRLFDVDDATIGDWSADARNWAESTGLVLGDGNKKGWGDFITKEQLVIILYRFKDMIK